jgi:hypothetical protein
MAALLVYSPKASRSAFARFTDANLALFSAALTPVAARHISSAVAYFNCIVGFLVPENYLLVEWF